MSIFDTFLLIFQGDSTSAVKAAKESSDAADHVGSHVQETEKHVGRLGQQFERLAERAAEYYTIYASFEKVKEFIEGNIEAATQLQHFSQSIGENIEEVSAWGDAVKRVGGSSEAFEGTVRQLSESFAMVEATGHSRIKPFFDELKIQLLDVNHHARSVFDVLPEIAERFEHIARSQSFGIGEKLGIDPATILLLQKGRVEVEKAIQRQKELGVVTEAQGELWEKFEEHLADASVEMRSAFFMVSEFFTPAIERFSDVIGGSIDKFEELDGATHALGIALGLVAAFFFPLVAVGVALTLVADDAIAFDKGQKSFIGYIIDKYPAATIIVDTFRIALEGLAFAFKEVTTAGAAIGLYGLGILKNTKDGPVVGSDDAENQQVMAQQAAFRVAHQMEIAQNTPLGSVTTSSIANSSNANASQTNVVHVESVVINTQATDAAGISQVFQNWHSNQISNTASQFDTMVKK